MLAVDTLPFLTLPLRRCICGRLAVKTSRFETRAAGAVSVQKRDSNFFRRFCKWPLGGKRVRGAAGVQELIHGASTGRGEAFDDRKGGG
jgi:hypothetical protein